MKNRNAFIETFKTKEGRLCFIAATIALLAFLCISFLVPEGWAYKKAASYVCGLIMFAGCVMFTQFVGAVQNDIDREEREAQQKRKHPRK